MKVRASLLTPEEAIGSTKRQDDALLKGKERLLEIIIIMFDYVSKSLINLSENNTTKLYLKEIAF